jgi:hypothetical protein
MNDDNFGCIAVAMIAIVIIAGILIFFAQQGACENAGGRVTYNIWQGQFVCVNEDNVIIVP